MKDIEEDKKEKQEEVQNPPAPAPSVAEMEQAHAEELSGLQQTNQQRYNDVSDIIAEAETKLGAMKQKDEVAQKRSNAFRYIAGLGDTLSGIANLVGTAHGAQNQQQVYNGGRVAERAEQSRKERKLEMDNMNTRIDEMRARQRELRTAGSLAEAEMKARQARELATEKNRVAAIEREEAWKKKQLEIDLINAEANLTRAEASKTNAETDANKPPKTTSPKKQHSFDLVGGKSITIPEHLWTDTAITSVYSSIPEELRTRRQRMRKNIAGIDEPEVDASGNPVYHTPTRQEMLNDIVAIAKTNEDVANALRKYAIGATAGANDPEFE